MTYTVEDLMDASEECGKIYDIVYSHFDEELYDLKNELKVMIARMEDGGNENSALQVATVTKSIKETNEIAIRLGLEYEFH